MALGTSHEAPAPHRRKEIALPILLDKEHTIKSITFSHGSIINPKLRMSRFAAWISNLLGTSS
jgi:hypothetical protein